MTVSPLIRAALFVADLERASAFYRVLGLDQVYFEGDLDEATTNPVLGTPVGTRTRCRILKKQGAPNFGMVGLFALSHPTPPMVARASGGPNLGEVALVFYCDALDAALDAVRAAGAAFVGTPARLVMPHRPEGQREVCVRDPDGVLINLIEKPDLGEAFETLPVLELLASRGGA